jgi:hypothetical protein
LLHPGRNSIEPQRLGRRRLLCKDKVVGFTGLRCLMPAAKLG